MKMDDIPTDDSGSSAAPSDHTDPDTNGPTSPADHVPATLATL